MQPCRPRNAVQQQALARSSFAFAILSGEAGQRHWLIENRFELVTSTLRGSAIAVKQLPSAGGQPMLPIAPTAAVEIDS